MSFGSARLQRSAFRMLLLRSQLSKLVTGPLALFLLPANLLLWVLLDGQNIHLVVALIITVVAVLAALRSCNTWEQSARPDRQVSSHISTSFETTLDAALFEAKRCGNGVICILVQIDRFDDLLQEDARNIAETSCAAMTLRLQGFLRRQDQVFALGHGRFGVLTCPPEMPRKHELQDLANRLQTGLSAVLPQTEITLSVSLGVTASTGAGSDTGRRLIDAAKTALYAAQLSGPASIELREPLDPRSPGRPQRPSNEVACALADGSIRAWFQPQVSTDTGEVSGFEALARWHHPERGIVLPGSFLPSLEAAGLLPNLQMHILSEALRALTRWQAHGLYVPAVGVNFSPQELSDPTLADKIFWEIDRHDLTPERINVEILETVVSMKPEDTAVQNITRLAEMGCHIDLDDFGTGHASISTLQAFPISRLKIDRSFVQNIDNDPKQQSMVTAILTMAEQLQLDTLAEGIESPGEHALLAQLGCGHVQGFGIARPMPFDATLGWMEQHQSKIHLSQQIQSGQRF